MWNYCIGCVKWYAKKIFWAYNEINFMPFLKIWKLKIKKVIVFPLLCAIVILVVKYKDSGMKVQIWDFVCSAYISYSFLICKMGNDLPPRAVIWTENEKIFEKHPRIASTHSTIVIRVTRIAVVYSYFLCLKKPWTCDFLFVFFR